MSVDSLVCGQNMIPKSLFEWISMYRSIEYIYMKPYSISHGVTHQNHSYLLVLTPWASHTNQGICSQFNIQNTDDYETQYVPERCIFTARKWSYGKVMFSLMSLILSTTGVDIPGPMFFPGILGISGPRSLSGIGISGRLVCLGMGMSGRYAQGVSMPRGEDAQGVSMPRGWVCSGVSTLPLTSPLLLIPNGGHQSHVQQAGVGGYESHWNVFLWYIISLSVSITVQKFQWSYQKRENIANHSHRNHNGNIKIIQPISWKKNQQTCICRSKYDTQCYL